MASSTVSESKPDTRTEAKQKTCLCILGNRVFCAHFSISARKILPDALRLIEDGRTPSIEAQNRMMRGIDLPDATYI